MNALSLQLLKATLWPFFCSFWFVLFDSVAAILKKNLPIFMIFWGTKIGIQINLSMRVLNVCNRKKESNKKVNFGPVDDVFCVCKCATMPASLCVF